MENLVGQTLNRYQIVSLLGEGGMGSVYRGYDTTLQRDVAIKVMHPNFARQPNFQERFLQEARTAARLNHPGIVQIHDFGSHRSQLYIVMKFIPGANLEEMLRDLRNHGRWIPLGEAVNLIRQVALALDYAHRQGVLHRDIKPGNIMVEPEPSDGLPYHPVVTDLGLAKLVQGGAMTQDGTSMGTPAYMSPEQALGKPTDARSDVYSLGILLYELVTGRLPFNPRTLAEAIQYHVNTRPPSARSIRPDIPDELEQVITQALQKDPGRRFQSALALAEALRGVVQSTARVAGPPPGLSDTVSLVTQYQNSLVDERGPSVFGDTPPARSSSRDRIQVLAGDQTSREIMFTPPGMTIGRDPATDIFIDDPKVSRQHARIEYDGQAFRVVDLNSTNGTFLGGQRLPPNVPQPWRLDQTLQVGGAYLRLLHAGGQAQVPATAAIQRGQPFEVYPARQPGTNRMPAAEAPTYEFSSNLVSDQLRAGEIGQVIIHNHGAADNFSINWISPGEALTFNPPFLQVDVDAGQEVVAEFRADPRSSRLVGGTRAYPFSVQISPSTGNPQMHHGQVASRAAIPGWLIPLLLVLCLALLGLLTTFSGKLFGGGNGVISGADATRTGNYSQTQIAQAVQQTREAGSATARALEGANAATLQSATRTGEVQGTVGAITASARQTGEAVTAAAIQMSVQTSVAQTAGAQAATQQTGYTQTAQAQQTGQAGQLTLTAGAVETAAQTAAAQTAAAQTAAAQSAAQTAAAQTAAAQNADQTASAQSAAQTAAAQSAAQTMAAQAAAQTAAAQTAAVQTMAAQTAAALTAAAPVERRVVYVYRDNTDLADEYRSFLQSQDYEVDTVAMTDVFGTDFSTYQVILIGPDTSTSTGDPGNPWGDSDESQANFIAAANRPVVGLGQGGSLFFEALGLYIRYDQSGSGNGRDVYVPNPTAPYWTTPAAVEIPGDQVLRLYDDDSSFVAVPLSTPVAEVTPVARQADNPDHYPVIQQGARFLLWGFDASPNDLSSQGRRTLTNLLRNLAP